MAAEKTIADNFRTFAAIFSPHDSGGVFNYLFEPVNVSPSESETLLQMSSQFDIVGMLKEYFLSTKQNTRVLQVLPENIRANGGESQFYPVLVGLALFTFLISLILWFATICIPCSCLIHARRMRKRMEKYRTPQLSGTNGKQRRAYFGMGVTVLVLLVFLIFCTIFAFISVYSVVQNLGKDKPDSLGQSVVSLFNETRAFLREMPVNGTRATDVTMKSLNGTIFVDLEVLVKFVMEKLLTAYGAVELQTQTTTLSSAITSLGQQTTSITAKSEPVLNGLTKFKQAVDADRTDLQTAMTSFCTKIPAGEEKNKCTGLTNGLSALVVTFDPDQLQLAAITQLSQKTTDFGKHLTTLTDQLSSLQVELTQQEALILKQIAEQIDFTQQFSAISELWTTLENDVTLPVSQQLDSLQPTLDNYLKLASQIGGYVGYILVGLSMMIIVIMAIYFGLCVSEAYKRGLMEDSPQTDSTEGTPEGTYKVRTPRKSSRCLCVGYTFPVLLAFLFPLIILIFGVLFTVLSLVDNEACRYVYSPGGVRFTDASLNLYLRNIWPGLVADLGGAETAKLLQLSVPHDLITSLQENCKPTSGSPTQPGLFPALGTGNMVNVSAVLSDPSLLKTISDFQGTLETEVLKIDFASLMPANLDEVKDLITTMTTFLNGANYNTAIDALRGPWLDVISLNTYLTALKDFVRPYVGTIPEANTIMTTVDSLENTFSTLEPIEKLAGELIPMFENLQKFSELTKGLEDFSTTLTKLHGLFNDVTALKKPIGPIYKTGTDTLLIELNKSLPAEMVKFTTDVVSCDKIRIILNKAVSLSCGDPNGGILNRLGGMCFLLLLQFTIVVFTVFMNQVFLVLHQKLCMTEYKD